MQKFYLDDIEHKGWKLCGESSVSGESTINMWGVKLKIMFQGYSFLKNSIIELWSRNTVNYSNFVFQIPWPKHWIFKIIKICKSSVSGELTINMWGVKFEIMFWGCRFLKINKNGITITQFSQLHKFFILQFPFTNMGSCLT